MVRNTRPHINVADLPVEDATALARALPPSLARMAAPIFASRSMLDLRDDWDGEGSPGYDETTWMRAVGFLLASALELAEDRGVAVPPPKIRKGPRSSIDLHWRTPSRELLVNVPANPEEPADYYGDDGTGGHVVKGTLDPTVFAIRHSALPSSFRRHSPSFRRQEESRPQDHHGEIPRGGAE